MLITFFSQTSNYPFNRVFEAYFKENLYLFQRFGRLDLNSSTVPLNRAEACFSGIHHVPDLRADSSIYSSQCVQKTTWMIVQQVTSV